MKKALNLSAFFVTCIFYSYSAYADCGTTRYDAKATVLRVIDGDTLQLTDKRKIRLIGVNAPELAHYPKKAEPLALRAKQFIESSLPTSKRINIKYGRQRKDRYGRLLAHLFLSDGRNLNAMLLEKGLASAIVVPPNSLFNECYFQLEQSARNNIKSNNRSIWSHKYFHYLEATKIDKNMTGFRYIKGRVRRVGRSRDSIWLQLASKFTVRIKRNDFKYFEKSNLVNLTLDKIKDKTLYIRGWVYEWKHEWYIQLRHPGMINLI